MSTRMAVRQFAICNLMPKKVCRRTRPGRFMSFSSCSHIRNRLLGGARREDALVLLLNTAWCPLYIFCKTGIHGREILLIGSGSSLGFQSDRA